MYAYIIHTYIPIDGLLDTYRAGTRATRASKRDVRRTRDNFWLKGYSFVMKSMLKVHFIDSKQAPREGRFSTEYRMQLPMRLAARVLTLF